ncbi:MAG: hypothetical protein PUG48_12240 [Clostridia bacterium]|nr:hypothetical protein [Clostridia bacterium]
MNLVILCAKTVQKYLNRNLDFKENNYSVLSYENELRTDFAKKITHLLPNIVVIFRGYRNRGADLTEEIKKIREKLPNIRIIYIYGKITDEQEFLKATKELVENGIYDISVSDLYEQGFKKDFFDCMKTPMDIDDFKELLQKRAENNKYFEVSETLQTEIAKVVDTTKVKFSNEEVTTEYSENETVQFDELQEWKNAEHFVIGVSSVHNSSGVIQTAFEMAIILSQAKQSISLFLPDSVYDRFLNFHEIDTTAVKNGCTVNNLPIYPLSVYSRENITAKYTITAILDINDTLFEKADIKIVMCRGTEWDISYLEEYLNLPLSYSKEINYCFYPISQQDFIKFNRAMAKGHCKAYRLRTSPNYTNPCQWNRDVYAEILHLYTDVNTEKKFFGKR